MSLSYQETSSYDLCSTGDKLGNFSVLDPGKEILPWSTDTNCTNDFTNGIKVDFSMFVGTHYKFYNILEISS